MLMALVFLPVNLVPAHHLGFYQFLQLIIDELGKTETVVRQMDDGYTRSRDSVRLRSPAAKGSCTYA
ncbi:hypothetical protein T4D_9981 [Trichinella pseudospiralis]|uniref:Uncharacterized protein n=1 Tax=Trichinella pseudospiralis TaxID=6337 RepID=A0A0V1F956_TRIPS|nr:hypothetical protein T4D_9981 [Trichinella pseudospiralis]